MLKKICAYFFAVLAASFGALVIIHTLGASDSNNIAASIEKAAIESPGNNYDINFIPTKTEPGSINIFEPVSTPLSLYNAKIIAGLFGIKEYTENTEAYFFGSYTNELEVYKDGSKLVYRAKLTNNDAAENSALTTAQIKKAADTFIREHFLSLSYETCSVDFSNGIYTVRFINTIENKKNYALTSSVTLDSNGNILSAVYYTYSYKQLGTADGISMLQALQNMQKTVPEAQTDISSGELVYYVNSSQLFPYYRFSGQTDGGEAFECFTPAFK